MTTKVIDALGIVHLRLVSEPPLPVPVRMAACGFLAQREHGSVSETHEGAQVTCLTCLVRAIETPGCMHETPGPVRACPCALRPGHEGPGVRCHCCPECAAECAIDPCDQPCCAGSSTGVRSPGCAT